ncbi:3958_t:CDS:2, partial [Racocetra persica]
MAFNKLNDIDNSRIKALKFHKPVILSAIYEELKLLEQRIERFNDSASSKLEVVRKILVLVLMTMKFIPYLHVI